MKKIGQKSIAVLPLCLLAAWADNAFAAGAGAQPSAERVVENAYHSSGGRAGTEPDRIETDVIDVSEQQGRRSLKHGATEQNKTGETGEVRAGTPNTDFWFYTADVELFADEDRDGYYHGIDLLFDADTVYSRAEVFAVVYLSLDGGPWTEYAETETFAIWGASGEDEYVIVTELLDGFPTGSYDVLIELFDTWDGSFVADFGPEDTSELSFLPLEDAVYDTPPPASRPVVVNRGGGGAVGRVSLFALGLLTLTATALRHRSRRAPRAGGRAKSA